MNIYLNKMATEKEHIKKAHHNENFYRDILSAYPDWAITGIFYSALHFIESFLAKKNYHSEDHKTRLKYVERVKELKPIFPYYRALYDYSVNARYKMYNFSPEDAKAIYETYFLPIKQLFTKNK